MADETVGGGASHLPFGAGVSWIEAVVGGLAVLALGVFVLVQPDLARDAVRTAAGAILIVAGAVWIWRALRAARRAPVASAYRMLGAGVAVTAGVVTLGWLTS